MTYTTDELQTYDLKSREQVEDIIELIRRYKRDEDFFVSENICTTHPMYIGHFGQRVWITADEKLIIEGQLEKKLNEEIMELVK